MSGEWGQAPMTHIETRQQEPVQQQRERPKLSDF